VLVTFGGMLWWGWILAGSVALVTITSIIKAYENTLPPPVRPEDYGITPIPADPRSYPRAPEGSIERRSQRYHEGIGRDSIHINLLYQQLCSHRWDHSHIEAAVQQWFASVRGMSLSMPADEDEELTFHFLSIMSLIYHAHFNGLSKRGPDHWYDIENHFKRIHDIWDGQTITPREPIEEVHRFDGIE